MKSKVYLDHNATVPLIAAARDAITELLAAPAGNPSSVHAEGRRARDRVERARDQVAALVGRPRDQIVFTSGGTEANALGVATLAARAIRLGLPRIVATTPIEHPSLLAAVHGLGWEIRWLAVSPDGAIAPEGVAGAGLVAVAAVNHELGTVLPDAVIAGARTAGALVHLDAVQAAGKRALAGVDADALAISAHKIGGPQGAGAVAIAGGEGADSDAPALAAGHQERGRRPGTENVIGIVGFGAAAAATDVAAWRGVAALGDRLEAGLRALPAVRIHGATTPRIGGTINAGFAGARGESIVIALDLAGIAASTGAACTSGTVQVSPVLRALGQPPERAREAVRFSLGATTTAADVDAVLAELAAILPRVRR